VTEADARAVMGGFAECLNRQDWAGLAAFVHPEIVWEYPQSGERFRGLANVRAQFENYPGLEPGSTRLEEIVGGTQYALTQMYTVVPVEGSGDRGVAINRAAYPDGSVWYAINIYELRDGLIARSRSYFAPIFDAPDWRAPYREAP
jgi:ketosteroid isomerase-like protein